MPPLTHVHTSLPIHVTHTYLTLHSFIHVHVYTYLSCHNLHTVPPLTACVGTDDWPIICLKCPYLHVHVHIHVHMYVHVQYHSGARYSANVFTSVSECVGLYVQIHMPQCINTYMYVTTHVWSCMYKRVCLNLHVKRKHIVPCMWVVLYKYVMTCTYLVVYHN